MPMVLQGKEWRAKMIPMAGAIKPPERAVQLLEAVRPAEQAVILGSPEMLPSFVSLVPTACDDKLSSVPTPEDDEELVDYSSSLDLMNLDINVVHLFVDGLVPTEEDFAHVDFGPIFRSPKTLIII
jgi:hypothetical protein